MENGKKKMQEKIDIIFTHYGYGHQRLKLIEECTELIRSVVRDDDENFIEEMADVSILIEQFTEHFPIYKHQFEKIRQEKVDRQIERIKNGD